MQFLTFYELNRSTSLIKLRTEQPDVVASKGFYVLYAAFLEIAMKADPDFESVSIDLQTTDLDLAQRIKSVVIWGIMERPNYPFDNYGALSVGSNGNYHILITPFYNLSM